MLRPKGTAAAITVRIVRSQLKRKCRLALDSIAERYSARRMHPFHSDKVFGRIGVSATTYRSFRRIEWPSAGASRPRGPPILKRRFKMKQLLIVLTLVVASAAPAMAGEFTINSVHAFGR